MRGYRLPLLAGVLVASLLLVGSVFPWREQRSQTALQDRLASAIQARDYAAMRRLLRSGADANFRTSSGATPLILAVGRVDAPAVELLLRAGANPDLPERAGWKPLPRALYTSGPDTVVVIERLLAAGADITASDVMGHPVSALLQARAELKHTLLKRMQRP